jgi:hypothetical protein
MSRLARVAALCALVAGATFVAPASAPAAGSSRAVVNVSGSNHVISFEGSVSGITALQMVASVATINYGGQGTAVCSINGVGNPAVPGQCLGEQGDGRYWSYWRAGPGAGGFSYSGGGGGGTSVSDGWVEGWNFGNGPPPFSSFCAVAGCAPPPPPPPPVTTPPTAAPPVTSAGGSAAATTDGTKAGDKRSGGSKQSDSGKESDDGKGGGASGSDTGSGTSGGSGAGRSGGGGRDGQQASGPLVSRPDDGGSPWGVAVAAGAFVALGAGGFYLRKRRRLSVPLE